MLSRTSSVTTELKRIQLGRIHHNLQADRFAGQIGNVRCALPLHWVCHFIACDRVAVSDGIAGYGFSFCVLQFHPGRSFAPLSWTTLKYEKPNFSQGFSGLRTGSVSFSGEFVTKLITCLESINLWSMNNCFRLPTRTDSLAAANALAAANENVATQTNPPWHKILLGQAVIITRHLSLSRFGPEQIIARLETLPMGLRSQ